MTTHLQRVEQVCESFENAADQHRAAQRGIEAVQREVTARMHGEIMDLRQKLALKNEAIDLLRECWSASEAELDELRAMLAEWEGVAA